MKTVRSIILTLLILGVAFFLIFKHQQAANSPVLTAIADDKAHGKPVWLLIHSTDELSIHTRAIFSDLQGEYARSIDFISVDFNDPAQKIVLKKYRVTGVPTSIFFDSHGKPVDKKIGQKPDDEYRDTLAQLLEVS